MTELTEFGRLRTSGNKKQLPRAEMARRIQEFLDANNVCVLATSLDDVPRATPIEYYAKDLVVYVAASPQTKIRNLEGNPRASVGIYNTPNTDWQNWYQVKGLQITGEAELIRNEEQPEAYAAAISSSAIWVKTTTSPRIPSRGWAGPAGLPLSASVPRPERGRSTSQGPLWKTAAPPG